MFKRSTVQVRNARFQVSTRLLDHLGLLDDLTVQMIVRGHPLGRVCGQARAGTGGVS